MSKQIRLNAFEMCCPGFIQQGLWTHPADQSAKYNTARFWEDLARCAESGLFDGIFLADVLGVYDVHAGSAAAALSSGLQVPLLDPSFVIPIMARVTSHIGFGLTANVSYDEPFALARRMSSLDHLTEGRLAWNIVTGYLDSAARATGRTAQVSHAERYARAEEFLDIAYRLWEGSWDVDAAVRCKETGVFTTPSKVRPVNYHGQHFSVEAIHLCEPSPQRTPVLYQAGASSDGRRFAARHAECVFISAPSIEVARGITRDLRQAITDAGRTPTDVAIFLAATVVVAPTSKEAKDKYEEYCSFANPNAALAQVSGTVGVDFSKYELDEPIRFEIVNGNRGALEALTKRASAPWTVRRLLGAMPMGSRNVPIVGSPSEVASTLIEVCAEAGVDGFNLNRTVVPSGLQEFVSLVVPELQARGAYKTAYRSGTLREKMFGRGPYLPAAHVGAIVGRVLRSEPQQAKADYS